jgi:8-oxo-dGTP diphosphatase
MAREYPDRPVVGIGGVLIEDGRTLLIKRGTEPLLGQWSIPGGTLELGESLQAGVAREMLEETGLEVKVLDMIEAFDRIFTDPAAASPEGKPRPKYHYVIVDYLCERVSGTPQARSDVTDVAFATEAELENFHLTSTAMRVLRRAFAMDRERRKAT